MVTDGKQVTTIHEVCRVQLDLKGRVCCVARGCCPLGGWAGEAVRQGCRQEGGGDYSHQEE
jgi:hypothetical protein